MTLQFQTITRDEALAFILSGMQAKRAEIDATLRDLRSQQNGPTTESLDAFYSRRMAEKLKAVAQATASAKPKRKVSPASRKRMAAAQKARWAKLKR